MMKAVLSMVAAMFLVTGCGMRQQHLTPKYGQSYAAAFGVQQGPLPRGPASAVTGLDSQEAAIISDVYRSGLVPKGVKTEEQPILLVAPSGRNDRTQKLAPSVPPKE